MSVRTDVDSLIAHFDSLVAQGDQAASDEARKLSACLTELVSHKAEEVHQARLGVSGDSLPVLTVYDREKAAFDTDYPT